MDLKNLCVSKEQAERLKEKGFPKKETAFVYAETNGAGWQIFDRWQLRDRKNYLSAPTLEELWTECGMPDYHKSSSGLAMVWNDKEENWIEMVDLKTALCELWVRRNKK